METTKEKIKEVERDTTFNEWKKKVLSLSVNEELDITCNEDRAMEGNILSWAYRLKKDNLFFRKETREERIFLARYK